jgi:hypothetical protein
MGLYIPEDDILHLTAVQTSHLTRIRFFYAHQALTNSRINSFSCGFIKVNVSSLIIQLQVVQVVSEELERKWSWPAHCTAPVFACGIKERKCSFSHYRCVQFGSQTEHLSNTSPQPTAMVTRSLSCPCGIMLCS